MQCNFTVGQKVVCIAVGDWSNTKRRIMSDYGLTFHAPQRGDVLTIRCIYTDDEDLIGLYFMEIHNPLHPKLNREYGFPYWEFAPLNERKTDISVFTKLLEPDLVKA